MSDVAATRLTTASPTPVTARVTTETAESPHSGGVTEQSAPTTIDPGTAKHADSPLSTPPAHSSLVPAMTAAGYVDSPHDVAAAAQGSLLPAPPAPPARALLPARPLPSVEVSPGVFHDWQPAARDAVEAVEQPASSADRKAKLAMALMVLCAAAILGVIVLSALRLSGLADLGLNSEELSAAFRQEALVWVPVVALCSVGLAAASLLRAKLN